MTSVRKTKPLDPFRQRLLPDVAGRWIDAKREHKIRAFDLWLGMMLQRFTPEELELLDDAGYLCQNDRDLLIERRTVLHPSRSDEAS